MKVGDLLILKNQRKGRYNLEGGYIAEIQGGVVLLVSSEGVWSWVLDDVEPFTKSYATSIGNEIVKPPEEPTRSLERDK